ncbi:MAG: 4Fe-4S dicluster domain-containing protein [Candidatus Latescibacterota bacterium]|nr:MAG: 4Fe-4S dicluster domain-containing protein [Candidatus Latescibacterota bacterium]
MRSSKGILIDTSLCTGCEECIVACKKENGLGKDRPWRGQGTIGELSASRWSTIIRKPGGHYVRNQCRHCLEPACVSACIVGALKKLPEGPVVYDENRCMGCRYCMLACPYGVPRYDWDRNTPLVQKCKLCEPRLAKGRPPACVEACPEKAMIFGGRDELITEAHRRIQANPNRYVPHVWGETEFGGTAVMYVSNISLDFLAWKPDTDDKSFPELSWAALKKVPGIVVGMGTLMAGTYWIIGRRMRLAAMEAEANKHVKELEERGTTNDSANEPEETTDGKNE